MTVEIVSGLEEQEGPDAEDQGTEDLVPDVEIEVGKSRPSVSEDAVIRVPGGVLGPRGTEGAPLLQAAEDEVHPEALTTLHPGVIRADVVLLVDAFLRPLDGNVVVAGKGLDPLLVFVGPFGQGLLGDGVDPMHIAEEMHDVLGTAQQR